MLQRCTAASYSMLTIYPSRRQLVCYSHLGQLIAAPVAHKQQLPFPVVRMMPPSGCAKWYLQSPKVVHRLHSLHPWHGTHALVTCVKLGDAAMHASDMSDLCVIDVSIACKQS